MRGRQVAVVLTALLALSLPGVGPVAAEEPAPPPAEGAAALAASGAELRAARAALLVRIAGLTDHAEGAQARLVAAQQRLSAATAAAGAAEQALADHAVEAFVHSRSLTAASQARGGVFAAVVVDADRAVVDAVREAAASAGAERGAADAALAEARRATSEVAEARRSLEATIDVHEERTAAARAEEERNALARRLAEEERAREEAEQRARAWQEAAATARPTAAAATSAGAAPQAGATGGGAVPEVAGGPAPPGGGGARPGDRTTRATAGQAELMARQRFGPVVDLPPGASKTGAVVEGMASWYGPGFDGRPTASGAVFDQEGWTVASKELPLGTVLLITRGDRSVLALVNDRGPFVPGRVLDLSRAVAAELGTIGPGVAHVRAEVVRLP